MIRMMAGSMMTLIENNNAHRTQFHILLLEEIEEHLRCADQYLSVYVYISEGIDLFISNSFCKFIKAHTKILLGYHGFHQPIWGEPNYRHLVPQHRNQL